MEAMLESLTIRILLIAKGILFGFLAFLFVGSKIVPGPSIQGVKLKTGERRSYKLNGLNLYLVVLLTVALAHYFKWFSLSSLHKYFFPLFVVTNIFAFAMTGVLYLVGKNTPDALEHEGPVGVLKALFYGVELNPTWWGVDLKMYSYRPSLIGLSLFNISFAVAQYEQTGALSLAMILYQVFTLIYVLNYFQFEHGMVFTWDIIAERFGWMLVWGDYVLVPFFYCIGGWFVLARTTEIPVWMAVLLCFQFALGFWLFRGANDQKHRFKMDPQARIWGAPAKTLGGRLLISGFWGIGRHLNYTGEILLYFAYIMTAGFASFTPYLLPTWLSCLLIHRAWRDDKRCREKHGELWTRYTRIARFKMFPFIY